MDISGFVFVIDLQQLGYYLTFTMPLTYHYTLHASTDHGAKWLCNWLRDYLPKIENRFG